MHVFLLLFSKIRFDAGKKYQGCKQCGTNIRSGTALVKITQKLTFKIIEGQQFTIRLTDTIRSKPWNIHKMV